MTPERWQQINQLWDAALELEPDQRAAFLDDACTGDGALRGEVESLMVAHQRARNFIESPPSEVAEDLIACRRDQSLSQRIGPYQVMSEIGRGGMGEVYLARDTRLGRRVALKLLPAESTRDEERVRRFEQEARAASALNHPNILTVYDIGQVAGTRFIATEFIEGETLGHRLAMARMKPREVLDIAIQVTGALAAAHQAGIVHRDIKPENIMLRPDGYVKVLDFGIAKLTRQRAFALNPEAPTMATAITNSGIPLGTISYMSPEQARGLMVDARTDIFSLGVVLYEILAGRKPFEGESSAEVLAAILDREPPPLAGCVPEAPPELQRIIYKAVRKNREERYQTIDDLLVDLKYLKEEMEFEAKLERSAPTETATRAMVVTGNAAKVATGEQVVARSNEIATVLAASGIGAIVSGIKRHKRGAALMLAALLLAIAGLTGFLYFAESGGAQIRSVAVLPFINVSNDSNMEYLSDGISESLINRLSQLTQLKVIARTSTSKYKNKEIDPQVVAHELGVQAIVTGRVLLHNDNLQISVELVYAPDKTQLWGEQYKRPAVGLLQLQEEISKEIAEKLRLRLTSGEQRQLSKRPTADPVAYELYLRGQSNGRKATSDGLNKAVQYYNQAVAIDPNYALAYAELARAWHALGQNSFVDPKVAKPNEEAAAKKALELDDDLAEAHLVLANIKRDAWDWATAEREYKRAIELSPNSVLAHRLYAVYLSLFARREPAIAEINRARELDPLSHPVNADLGLILFHVRQYDQAIVALKNSLELDQNYVFAHIILGYVYASKGQYADAITEYKESIKLDGETPSDQCYLGYALAMSGQRHEALALLNKLATTKEYVSPAELAILYASLGEKEKALDALERAYTAHDLQLQFLKVDPHYDSLRGEPRFTELMRRVGIAP